MVSEKSLQAIKKLAYGHRVKKVTRELNREGELLSEKIEVRQISPDRHMLAWLVNYEQGLVEEMEVKEKDEYGIYD